MRKDMIILFVLFVSGVLLLTTNTNTKVSSSCFNSSNEFIVEGEKDVEVKWCDGFIRDNDKLAYSVVNGDTISLNKKKSERIDYYTLMHELGHTIGFSHKKEGIMSNNNNPELGDEAWEIAGKYDFLVRKDDKRILVRTDMISWGGYKEKRNNFTLKVQE